MFWRLKNILNTITAKYLLTLHLNDTPIIFLYHGIDLYSNSNYNYRFSSKKDFSRQLKFYKNNYSILPLKNAFNSEKKTKTIYITFDDRYENWITHAYPIIKKHNIPVTFFTSSNQASLPYIWTDFIDIASKESSATILLDNLIFKQNKHGKHISERDLSLKDFLKNKEFEYKIDAINQFKHNGFDINKIDPTYWKVLSDKQINTLSKDPLIEIGSHADNHNNLGQISLSLAKEELIYSKNKLETITGKDIFSIAYPDGSYNRKIIDVAEKIGYKNQLACDYLHKEDLDDIRILNRKGIYTHLDYYQQLANVLC
jgi:peptidoglycan/xylan/chitin deacetylase (PgdA/CDA1 family)